MIMDPDREDVEAAQAGDPHAFQRLVIAYREKALGLAMSMVKVPEQAADVVQDAFIKCHASLTTFRFNSKFSTWLYRIVYTTSLKRLCYKRRSSIF